MTQITVEQLLEIVKFSRATIELPSADPSPEWMRQPGERFEYMCPTAFMEGLRQCLQPDDR